MKDWYKYQPWNFTCRAWIIESRHMTYNTTALLPSGCFPMAFGPFRDPKGWSYTHPKYWTHRWRIDINISNGMSPIVPSSDNQGTWHILRRHYYQVTTAQWRMTHFWTPIFFPIHTRNIGPIHDGLISISAIKSRPHNSVEKIKTPDISHDGTTTK